MIPSLHKRERQCISIVFVLHPFGFSNGAIFELCLSHSRTSHLSSWLMLDTVRGAILPERALGIHLKKKFHNIYISDHLDRREAPDLTNPFVCSIYLRSACPRGCHSLAPPCPSLSAKHGRIPSAGSAGCHGNWVSKRFFTPPATYI